MRTPIADFEVHLQLGVRAQVMSQIIPAADADGCSPEDFLDKIALSMKEVRNGGGVGPGHQLVPRAAMPPSYSTAYASVHDEFYHGVWVRYGIQPALSRLVLISAAYVPAQLAPKA